MSRPLEGIRVIDLGVIVAGGELSRLFGDLGAEVIKVESSAYPDGLRQKRDNQAISESFARAHRNNLGLGLELRSPAGAELFARLVAASDAVFANFKPGTLPALGFSFERLQELNPGVVLAESSAFGDTGPWSRHMGYGPLVRATIGVTGLWTSEQAAARGRPAPVLRRDDDLPRPRGGPDQRDRCAGRPDPAAPHRRGARIHVSQAEAAINQLDTIYVTQAAEVSGVGDVVEDGAVHRVLACAGDDEWCVVSLRSEADRRAVATAIGHGAGDLDAALAAWVAERSPAEVTEALQAAGVPAGPMNRADDVHDDPQLRLRNVFSDMAHPLFEHPLVTEAGPAHYRSIPPAPQNPAPLPGADTRRICRDVLGMTADEVEGLIADGVLFTRSADRTGVRDMSATAQVFIDGRFRAADQVEPVLEAATGEKLGDGASATEADIDAAVAAARGGAAASGARRHRTTAPNCWSRSPPRWRAGPAAPTSWSPGRTGCRCRCPAGPTAGSRRRCCATTRS